MLAGCFFPKVAVQQHITLQKVRICRCAWLQQPYLRELQVSVMLLSVKRIVLKTSAGMGHGGMAQTVRQTNRINAERVTIIIVEATGS